MLQIAVYDAERARKVERCSALKVKEGRALSLRTASLWDRVFYEKTIR